MSHPPLSLSKRHQVTRSVLKDVVMTQALNNQLMFQVPVLTISLTLLTESISSTWVSSLMTLASCRHLDLPTTTLTPNLLLRRLPVIQWDQSSNLSLISITGSRNLVQVLILLILMEF